MLGGESKHTCEKQKTKKVKNKNERKKKASPHTETPRRLLKNLHFNLPPKSLGDLENISQKVCVADFIFY